MDPRTLTELGIGVVACALVFYAFRIFLRFFLEKFSKSMEKVEEACRCLQSLMQEIEKSMVNRDQIVLNHLEHFQETQERIVNLLQKLCRAWEINNGR